MRRVYVTLRDGSRLEGLVWEFRPTAGWFSLVVNHSREPTRIQLQDVQTAIVSGRGSMTTNYNLLDQAREEGWV